ncbi:hypothetical protein B0H11DRAFT_1939378 [Mycena galericulata]|nr:hypothetical protein B0H11DRAFT_1939378 [Mycena galericulata]
MISAYEMLNTHCISQRAPTVETHAGLLALESLHETIGEEHEAAGASRLGLDGETWRKNVITGRTRMPSDPSVSKRVTVSSASEATPADKRTKECTVRGNVDAREIWLWWDGLVAQANKWGQDAPDARASTVTGCTEDASSTTTEDASSATTGGDQQRPDEGRLNLGLAWYYRHHRPHPSLTTEKYGVNRSQYAGKKQSGKESARAKRTEIVGGQTSNAERHEGREENLDHDREGGGSKIAVKQFLKGEGDKGMRTAL